MNKRISYLVAILACAVIIIAWSVIGAACFGWKHGGGILPMMLLLVILSGVWKGITGLAKKDKGTEEKPNDTNIEKGTN
jgi:hypothetical protein